MVSSSKLTASPSLTYPHVSSHHHNDQLPVEVWSSIVIHAAQNLPDLCRLSTLNRSIRHNLWTSSSRPKSIILASRHDIKDLVRSPTSKFIHLPDAATILSNLIQANHLFPKHWPNAIGLVLHIPDAAHRMSLLRVLLTSGFPVNPGGVVDAVRSRETTVDELSLFLDHTQNLLALPGRVRAFQAGLMTACSNSHTLLHLLRHLIDVKKCNPNLADREGRSALHVAAMTGNIPALNYLLSVQADPELRDFYGRRPIENAAVWREFDAVLLLLRQGVEVSGRFFLLREPENASVPLIHVAAAAGNLEVVKSVMEKLGKEESGVEAVTPEGRNAVHLAAYFGHAEVVKYLCEIVGPDGAGKRDFKGRTAAFYADRKRFEEVVGVLKEFGVNV